jgi:hypothetical protein
MNLKARLAFRFEPDEIVRCKWCGEKHNWEHGYGKCQNNCEEEMSDKLITTGFLQGIGFKQGKLPNNWVLERNNASIIYNIFDKTIMYNGCHIPMNLIQTCDDINAAIHQLLELKLVQNKWTALLYNRKIKKNRLD